MRTNTIARLAILLSALHLAGCSRSTESQKADTKP